MKKGKNIILLTGLALSMLLSVSCKKILDQEPRNSTYGEAFWKDPNAGTTAVAGNYALMRDMLSTGMINTNNRYYAYGETAANLGYTMFSADGYGNMDIQNGNFAHNYVAASLGDWTAYYKTIAMANIILKQMKAVPESVLAVHDNPENYRNNILGQALFIRALTYFMLVRTWGDVPMVIEAYDDPIRAPHLGRTPKLEVMAQIEKDCKDALTYLKWEYNNSSEKPVTANKGAVNALLAHLYLWRATVSNLTTNTPIMADVDKAADAIFEIETRGSYALTDTANYYQTFIGRSTESIFEINKSENTLEGTNTHIANLFLNRDYINGYGINPFYRVNQSYLNSHFYKVETVTAWAWYWDPPGQWVWREGTTTTKSPDNSDIRRRKNFTLSENNVDMCIKYSNVIYRNPGQKLDHRISNNMPIFRLADVKLLKAEIAIYKNQDPVAVDIINGFRRRNNAHASQLLTAAAPRDSVMNAYIEERYKELFLEGHIFYDLIRTRKCFDIIGWLSPTSNRFAQEGFYWPVAPALFKENKYLVQTQYWRGKI